MNKKNCLISLVLAGVCCSLSSGAKAQGVRYSNEPLLTSSAQGVLTVVKESPVIYAVTVTDKDAIEYWVNMMRVGVSEFADTTVALTPVNITSMKSGFVYNKRGTTGAVTTWDIVGTAIAVTNNTTCADSWQGSDDPISGYGPVDPYNDCTQTVIVKPS